MQSASFQMASLYCGSNRTCVDKVVLVINRFFEFSCFHRREKARYKMNINFLLSAGWIEKANGQVEKFYRRRKSSRVCRKREERQLASSYIPSRYSETFMAG